MTTRTLGSDFTGGSLLPRYVDGRLLSATDLTTDQTSLRVRDQWVGQAVGTGVVRGLWVTGSATVLSVAPGLGLNRAGEPISLTAAVGLPLAVPLAPGTARPASGFACCQPGSGEASQSPVDTGAYLLTVRPASRTHGQAQVAAPPGSSQSGLNQSGLNQSGGCTAGWVIAGVEFRVTSLPSVTSMAGVAVTTANRRNLVAHWCFGTVALAKLAVDPFTFDGSYRGLDTLAGLGVRDDDLPLAVFGWNGQAISDLDNWSARRRVVTPESRAASWSVLNGDERLAEGQARLSQFQDQIDSVVGRGTPGTVTAGSDFGLLPPLGFLPVGERDLRSLGERLSRQVAAAVERAESQVPDDETEEHRAERVARERTLTDRQALERDVDSVTRAAEGTIGVGFDPRRFFGTLARAGGILDWELADFLLRQSWYQTAVSTRGFEETEEEREVDQPNDDREGRNDGDDQRPFTYYYVRQNLAQLSRVTKVGRRHLRGRRRGFGSLNAHLYVVFVANAAWVDQARPPVRLASSLLFGQDLFDPDRHRDG